MRTLAAAILALALAVPSALQAQNVSGFEQELRQMDPNGDAVRSFQHIGDGVMKIVVTDGWYHLRCYQRQRFAKSMRTLWRKHGGSNVWLEDKAGTEVADFKIFGSDFDIRGCDD